MLVWDLESEFKAGTFTTDMTNVLKERKLFDLLLSNTGSWLHPTVLELQNNWDEWRTDEPFDLEYEALIDSDVTQDNFQPRASQSIVYDLVHTLGIKQSVRTVQAAITPHDRRTEECWDYPMNFLIDLAKKEDLIILDPIDYIQENKLGNELPNSLLFQLDFLQALGKAGYRSWAINDPSRYFRPLMEWLIQIGNRRPMQDTSSTMQRYLALTNKREAPSLREYLTLPDTKEHPVVTKLIRFWTELRRIKNECNADVKFFERSKEDQQTRVKHWIEDPNPSKQIVIGISSATIMSKRPRLELVQYSAIAEYESPKFVATSALAHGAHNIGERRGWGDRQSALIPVRENSTLREFLKHQSGVGHCILHEDFAIVTSESEGQDEEDSSDDTLDVETASPKFEPHVVST